MNGAAGGVGTFAVQIAKSFGAPRYDNAETPDDRKIEVEFIMRARLDSRVIDPNRTLIHLSLV